MLSLEKMIYNGGLSSRVSSLPSGYRNSLELVSRKFNADVQSGKSIYMTWE